MADCFWQQIIDLFIFSFCPIVLLFPASPPPPPPPAPLPPFFSKPSETWRGVSTSRGKVCRPGGRKGRRTSFRERYAGGTIIGYPRLTNCTVNRPRFNEALSSSLLACRMENEKRNYPLPDEPLRFCDRWSVRGGKGGGKGERAREIALFSSISALQPIDRFWKSTFCRRLVRNRPACDSFFSR